MSDVMEHVAYLSQEIGPRPAGTEEEQQAALYITEKMQKDAGLSAVIEDFTGVANNEVPRAICGGVTLVFAILAVVLPVVALPAAIVTLLSAIVYVVEALDKPLLSRVFSRGVSQNVVAKYEPGYSAESGGTRRRKVILVAHYDSGKTLPELKGPVLSALPILKWVIFGAFIAVPVLLLLATTVLLHVGGAVGIVLNVLTIVCAVLAALPLIQCILHKTASYNDGANCNASGVAVLLDAAERVGRGRTDMSSLSRDADDVTVHGEQAAREAGLIPEGARVSYEAVASEPAEDDSPAARLAAAKAAVAALSGKPVSDFVAPEPPKPAEPVVHMPDFFDGASSDEPSSDGAAPVAAASAEGAAFEGDQAQSIHVDVQIPERSLVQAAAEQAVPAQPETAQPEEEADTSGLPAWFVAAQKKAKKPQDDAKPVQRSRYADALEAAVTESSVHFQEANNVVLGAAQQRMEAMSDGIVEVKAPQSALLQPEAAAADAAFVQPAVVQEQPVVEVTYAAEPTRSAEAAAPVAAEPTAEAVDASAAVSAPTVSEAGEAAARPAEVVAQTAETAGRPAASAAILPEDLSVPAIEDEKEPEAPAFLFEQQPSRQSEEASPRTENRIEVDADDELDFEFDEPAQRPDATIACAPVFVDTVTASTSQATEGASQQPIVLPSLTSAEVASAHDGHKQRAPLADAYDPDAPQTRTLRSSLPSIDPAHPNAHRGPSAAQLRSALPSFSGILPKVGEEQPEEESSSTVSMTGSFAPVGATSSFAPVGDELLDDVDPDDIYIDDADDSTFQDPHNEAGAFATPGYVEMPKSRVRRLFDRFHRGKKADDESSPQEWLDVDESFDARSVGAARGGWESFREEQDSYPDADDYYDDELEAEPAQPGSRQTEAAGRSAGGEQPRQSAPYAEAYGSDEFDDAFDDDFYDDYGYEDEAPSKRRSWHGGAFSRVRMGRVDTHSGADGELAAEGDDLLPKEPEAPEMQKIHQFRNPDIDTEVWFVALGAELGGHSGMRAFIAEHEHDLKGSIIIELEALGAGELSMIDQEGGYRVAKTSSRMRRYTRKASQTTGASVGSASMLWKSSASSYAITHGLQAMHLVGMEGAKPASFGSRDDIADNIDEKVLQERSDFVMELLKNI